MSDLVTRVSSGEDLDVILRDLHYGIEAEVSEFLERLLERSSSLEVTICRKRHDQARTSPEPTILLPLIGGFLSLSRGYTTVYRMNSTIASK
jgi:hypothetical protein